MILPKGQMAPQGDAKPADVLAGKKYMGGGSFALKTGTMPDMRGVSPAKVNWQGGVPTEVRIEVPTGYYEAGNPGFPLFAFDPNFVEGNIAATKSVFGLNGTFTADGTATAADIAKDKTAYVNGQKITGTYQPASQPNFFAYDGDFVGEIQQNSPTETVIKLGLLFTGVRLLAIAIKQLDENGIGGSPSAVWNNGGGVQVKLSDLILSAVYNNDVAPFGNTFTLQGVNDSLTVTVGVPTQKAPNQYDLNVTLTTQVDNSLTSSGLGDFHIWGWTIPAS